jgi:hypothetical protein
MKPIIPFALLGALLAVGAADAAATTPVGYTTNLIKAAFSPTSAKNNFISLPLVNSAAWTGTVTSVAGDVVTLSAGASPLVAGAYNNIDASFPGTDVYAYYLEAADGFWTHIDTNATGSVTVEVGSGASFTNGESVTIRRHRTISDIFGATNAAGLLGDAGGDSNNADNITIIDEVNGGTVGIIVAPGVVVGALYIDSSFQDADDYPVYPDQGLQVLRRGATDLTVTVTGEVHNRPTQIGINTGFQIRPVVLPVPVSLGELNLYTGNIATGLKGTALGDLNDADGLSVVVDGVPTVYFYSTVDFDAAPGDQIGWYDDSFNYVNDVDLPAGAALNISRNNAVNSAPFTWVNPAPTIAP